ncbi:MAG: hypothetical protein ACI8Y4_003530 [Candidatus Poriferisodalaceae bacterium]|jgi:hypothetical protein
MTPRDRESSVDLTGVVCPFHAAGANPANAQPADAPAPSKPGQRNSLSLLYKHAQFHAGMDRKGAVTTMLIGVLGGKKWSGVARNLVTWSYDPAELERSPLNKHPQNSGMMSRAVPGTLAEDRLVRLLAEFGSEYEPADGGAAERGVAATELDAFLDTVATEANVSERTGKLGRKLANAELPVVLKVWPSTDASGGSYVAESTLRALYGEHLFPSV